MFALTAPRVTGGAQCISDVWLHDHQILSSSLKICPFMKQLLCKFTVWNTKAKEGPLLGAHIASEVRKPRLL